MNESRRAALGLRDRMIDLNAEISENRKRLLTADQAQQQTNCDTQSGNSCKPRPPSDRDAAKRSGTGTIYPSSVANWAGFLEGIEKRQEAQDFSLVRVLNLQARWGAIGITELGFAAVRFGREAVNAAVKVEGFQNSLTALYGDAQ